MYLAGGESFIKTAHKELQEKVFSQGCLALITPTLSTPYVPADYDATHDGEVFMTFPWNLLFAYPIVAVPASLSEKNVPVGVQVIGNTYQDLDAFRVAMGLSKVLPQLYKEDRFPTFTRK